MKSTNIFRITIIGPTEIHHTGITIELHGIAQLLEPYYNHSRGRYTHRRHPVIHSHTCMPHNYTKATPPVKTPTERISV